MTLPAIPVDIAPSSLKYSLTRRDLFWWHLYLIFHNRVLYIFWILLSAFMAWTDLRTPELIEKPLGNKILFVVFMLALNFAIMAGVTIILTVVPAFFKKFRGLLGNHELEIQEEGLLERTDINESFFRWKGFHKIVRTGRHLYIYVTDNNVHVVPIRSFPSTKDADAFQQELKKRSQLP